MESVHSFLDAASTFGDRLAEVQFRWLALALGLHFLNLMVRSVAWRNILRAAYPEERLPAPTIIGAYVAGVGINSFAPARGGDLVKLYAVRQRVPATTAPTLIASLIAETIFDFFVASGLLAWAYASGRLPQLPQLPNERAFELSFFARHEQGVSVAIALVILLTSLFVRVIAHHVRRFWERVGQGLSILRTPRRYLSRVVSYQAIGWLSRLGTAYCLLEAFGIHATWQNAILVQVVMSIATLLPFTPGGAGAQQALLVVALAGAGSRSDLLAYSVGAQAALTVFNTLLGAIALLAVFRTVRLGHLRHRARAAEPEAP